MTREKLVIRVGDYLYLTSPIENKPYIGEVIKLFETDEGEPTTTVRWLFHLSDTKLTPADLYERLTVNKESVEKEGVLFHDRELFYSDDFDDNPIASVEGKCHVEHLPCHLSSPLFSRMSDFESEGTQGDEDSQFSSQFSNTALTPKDNELLEKLVTFIQKPDSFFFRKWYSCGHFGHMPSVDFVFSPYIDKSYENYELPPQTLPAKAASSQATPFVIDDSIPMPGVEEGGKEKEENKSKEREEEEEETMASKNSHSKRKKKPLIETSKSKKSKQAKPEPELEEEEEEEG
jgi:hypothetical protein